MTEEPVFRRTNDTKLSVLSSKSSSPKATSESSTPPPKPVTEPLKSTIYTTEQPSKTQTPTVKQSEPTPAQDEETSSPATELPEKTDAPEETIKPKSEKSEVKEVKVEIAAASTADIVDMIIFGQLLEIDDDDSHDFSKTLAMDYITQANTTFTIFDEALADKDLATLSDKGHFLKGSSAALGLQRVKKSCELMQHYGARKNEHGEGPEMDETDALLKCEALLVRLKAEQEEGKKWLSEFFKEPLESL